MGYLETKAKTPNEIHWMVENWRKTFRKGANGNQQLKISLKLRSKVSELALETLIEACIGKEAKK